MKRSFTLLFLLTLVVSCRVASDAQRNPPVTLNAAIESSKLGDADYPAPAPNSRHDEKVAAIRSGHYDLVLIGGSITHTLGELGGKYEQLRGVW